VLPATAVESGRARGVDGRSSPDPTFVGVMRVRYTVMDATKDPTATSTGASC
jgi:hypothetical protein